MSLSPSSRTPLLAVTCFAIAVSVSPTRAQSKPPVTAHFQVDRSRVYLGETFAMTLTIQANGVGLGKDIDLKGMPGPATLERSAAAELPTQRRQVGSAVVETRRFRFDVTPKRLGPLRLAPILSFRVLQRRGFMTFQSQHNVRVNPLTLTVLPVPAVGKPADFSDAIGKFDFDVSLSPTELAPGDLITARIVIQGHGKFDDVRVPRFSPDGHFKVYDPEPVKEESSGLRHVYTQVLIPQSTNATQVGSIAFSFFDAAAGKYRTIERGPFALRFKQRQKETVEHYRPEEREQPPRRAVAVAVKRKWETSPAARVALALALYWIAAVTVVSSTLVSLRGAGRRRGLKRVAAAVGILAVFVLGSTPYRSAIARTLGATHTAATTRQAAARLAPSLNALESFSLSAEATVQIDEAWEDWVRVTDGKRGGWIPAEAVELR